MGYTIEDTPVPVRDTFISVVEQLQVGQSFYARDKTYASAMTSINQAKRRIKSPLVGSFRVVPEGTGVRVGRIG